MISLSYLRKVFSTLILATIAITLLMYGETVKQIILIVGYTVIGAIGLVTILGVFFGSWYLSERIKLFRAGRIEAEKNAHVLIAQNGEQIFIRDTDPKAQWKAAHLIQRSYFNGKYETPTQDDKAAWQKFIASQSRRALTKGDDIIEGEFIQPVNLLDELDKTQRCLIVGASNAGKTTLLKHVINRRLALSQIVVIDPHSHPDKWPGCDVVGIGRNYSEIEYTLNALVDLMTKRYEEIGRGEVKEESHPRLTVIIDEWRAIVMNTTNASETITALLTESRKAAFSVFVATHSERVKALGIEGEGDLKDGFLMVRLGWQDGQRIATIDRGNGETPASLPGEFTGYSLPSVYPVKPFMVPSGPKPDKTEIQILDLHDQDLPISTIAEKVYGHKSGNYNAKVKAVLEKFNK